MSILNNFDMDALRKARARKAAGSVDLEASLREITPDIEKLKPGQTAKIAIPNKGELRKFVMSITAKLNNLTPQGGKWAGRDFKVASDTESEFLYIQRGEDIKSPVVRRRGNGGGRRKAPATGTGEGTGGAPTQQTEVVHA